MTLRGGFILAASLSLVGACGGGAATRTPTATTIAEDEIVFFADDTIIPPGACTFLRWDAVVGFGVTLNGEEVETAGEAEVCPAASIRYELIVDMGSHVERRAVDVTVGDVGAPTTGEGGPEIVEPAVPAYEAAEWTSTGGPPGGLGYDIRMDPRDPTVMYVTDAWAGAFKSLDGGGTWFPVNTGITARTGPSGDAIPVFSLTIDPNAPDTVWTGTQFGGGAFRSDDGGDNWRSMSNGILEQALTIRGFTVEPGNSNIVYLAGEVSSWEWNGEPLPGLGLDMTKGVVYKSTDRGQNWDRIWYGDNLARYIWIHPEDHDLIYVSTGIFDREAANSDPATGDPGGVGILRSRDGGASWEVLGVDNGFRGDELYVGSLFMHPDDPNVLIAAAANDPYQGMLGHPIGGVYLTEDGGDHWDRVLELQGASVVEICNSDPDVMYAGSINGVYRSDDGGHRWEGLVGTLWGTDDVLAGFPIDMQCDPRDPMRVFVNNYIGGNFLSEDGGQTWKMASDGYTGALLRQISVSASDRSMVYVAGRMGVFVTADSGDTWRGTAHGPARVPEAIAVAVDPHDPAHVLAVLLDGGPDPKISRDGGHTWRNVTTGLWAQGGEEWTGVSVSRLVFSPDDPGLVLATVGIPDCRLRFICGAGHGRGIIRSADGGETWSPTSLVEGEVLDIDFFEGPIVYAAVYPSTVYRSSDGGQTWQPIAEGVVPRTGEGPVEQEPMILSIAADRAQPGRIYAGSDSAGVFISLDGGETWAPSSAGMDPETTVTAIAIDHLHAGVAYLASAENGVFYTIDGGSTWSAHNEGLPTRAAKDLGLSADAGVLYVGTDGGGVWRLGPVMPMG